MGQRIDCCAGSRQKDTVVPKPPHPVNPGRPPRHLDGADDHESESDGEENEADHGQSGGVGRVVSTKSALAHHHSDNSPRARRVTVNFRQQDSVLAIEAATKPQEVRTAMAEVVEAEESSASEEFDGAAEEPQARGRVSGRWNREARGTAEKRTQSAQFRIRQPEQGPEVDRGRSGIHVDLRHVETRKSAVSTSHSPRYRERLHSLSGNGLRRSIAMSSSFKAPNMDSQLEDKLRRRSEVLEVDDLKSGGTPRSRHVAQRKSVADTNQLDHVDPVLAKHLSQRQAKIDSGDQSGVAAFNHSIEERRRRSTAHIAVVDNQLSQALAKRRERAESGVVAVKSTS